MNAYLSFAIFFVLFVGCLPQVRGYTCNSQMSEDLQFSCEGYGSFCCDPRFGIYFSCCYTLWGVWYFWFCLVCGVFILASLIALVCGLCKKRRTRNNRSSNAHGSHDVTTISNNQTTNISDVEIQVKTKLDDAPPSYNVFMATQSYETPASSYNYQSKNQDSVSVPSSSSPTSYNNPGLTGDSPSVIPSLTSNA